MASILLLGFLMGLRHAVEADHVAAVAGLGASDKTQKGNIRHTLQFALRLGALWGLGHSISLFVIGACFIYMGFSTPPQFSIWMEFVIGILLIAIGSDLLYRLVKKRIHYHAHRHTEGVVHFHAHAHNTQTAEIHAEHKTTGNSLPRHSHDHNRASSIRSLFIGVAHGMAGSAALTVLMAETFKSFELSLLYIVIFSIGSIAGMMALSTIISIPLHAAGKSLSFMHGALQGIIAIATISIGINLSVSQWSGLVI
ncbi:MAG: hypothetical protein OEW37_08545 [Rhodospirillaceae bacterium]|nr:hypothetical protein [Rhodospirillaceae bacterium]